MSVRKSPRKTVRERALETCRHAMTLLNELTYAITTAELRQSGQASDSQVEAYLDAARNAATIEFTTAVAVGAGNPAGTGKDLAFWKKVCLGLQNGLDRVRDAMALIDAPGS